MARGSGRFHETMEVFMDAWSISLSLQIAAVGIALATLMVALAKLIRDDKRREP